jgi:hypothetical protein
LKSLGIQTWGLLERVVVHLRKIIKLILGVIMLTIKEVNPLLGLAATMQFTPWNILSTGSLLTQLHAVSHHYTKETWYRFICCAL